MSKSGINLTYAEFNKRGERVRPFLAKGLLGLVRTLPHVLREMGAVTSMPDVAFAIKFTTLRELDWYRGKDFTVLTEYDVDSLFDFVCFEGYQGHGRDLQWDALDCLAMQLKLLANDAVMIGDYTPSGSTAVAMSLELGEEVVIIGLSGIGEVPEWALKWVLADFLGGFLHGARTQIVSAA